MSTAIPVSESEIFDIPAESAHGGDGHLRLLEEASRTMGEINNFASGAMNFGFAVQALKNAEALASARIEGTTGNLQDLYLEEGMADEKKQQLKLFSAINYRVAMNEIEGIVRSHKKIDLALIRHLHKILSKNDPATKGTPGKFRDEDVRIRNSRQGDFFPPPHMKVEEYTVRLVDEVSARQKLPSLLQAAVTHYQFESIHPFRDGNGRTGRMLIIAQLLMDGALRTPMLNLSGYFDEHRDEYIDALREVSATRSYQKWIDFFLVAVKEQGQKNLAFMEQLKMVEKADSLVLNEHLRSPAASHILRHALNKLYITVPSAVHYLRDQHVTSADIGQIARTNIQRMVEEGVLAESPFKFGRAKVYAHKKLGDIMFGKNQKTSNNA